MLPLSGTDSRRVMFFVIMALWAVVGLCLGLWFISEMSTSDGSSKLYLLPWCVATGAVILFPSIYLILKGRFHPFHPLVFPAWSYFFPGFCIGGLVVALGGAHPYILSLVQDESYSLPLTFAYVMLGFGGMSLGYAVPYAHRFGKWIGGWLPKWEIPNNRIVFSALILMTIGLTNTLVGFGLGILGFQKVDEIGAFNGIIYLLSLFLLESSFLLWLYIFRSERIGILQLIIIGLLMVTAFTKSAFEGNRAGLIQIFVLVAFAYCFSGRKLTIRHYTLGGVLVTLAVIIGIIYGTTFRTVKGSDEQISLDQYVALVPATWNRLTEQDPGTILVNGISTLSERFDAISPLAVVVSNYEALAPYEEAWGINDNIYVDTFIFFIPRVVWPDKPVSIDPSRYGDLYFNYAENSFTLTPMGDLLRNFGPIGVPIGMFVLGMIIRVLYSTLIEGQDFSHWRVTLFFMMFTAISFEGTFGLIIPMLFKVGAASFLGLVIVRFCAGSLKKIS
jgi:hypothetical protein